MRPSLLLTLTAIGAMALSQTTAAQSVRGTVSGATGGGVPGVLVELIDRRALVVARNVSGELGEFRLAAPDAGVFRIRARRIGFRLTLSDTLTLVRGGEVARSVVLHGLPLALDTIRVGGRSSCRSIVDSSTAAFLVWEQARTALNALQATEGSRVMATTTATYQRVFGSDLRPPRESMRIRSDFVRQPWRTISPESLHRAGYVITTDFRGANYTTVFYAPGLDMLASSHFVEDHCFRLVRDKGRLGLAFQPSPDRKRIAEIRGTLWLDAVSSELRRLEFQYANVRRLEEDEGRGFMDFTRFANGAWAVTTWSIRMPLVEQIVRPGIGAEDRIAEITEIGGWLVLVRQGSDTLWAQPPVRFSGILRDSVSGAPLAAARVAVRGTALSAVTDQRGGFSITGILPGEYTLGVTTAALDSINIVPRVPVVITGETTAVRIRIPPAADLAKVLCNPGSQRPSTFLVGALAGGGTTTSSSVVVSAEWMASGNASSASWLEASLDEGGKFRICGVPPGVPIEVRARNEQSHIIASSQAFIPSGRLFDRVTLTAGSNRDRFVLSGRVLADPTRQALTGAEIVLPDLGKGARSNADGAFRVSDIPGGAHRLLIRRLGFAPLDTSLIVGDTTEPRTLRFSLSPVAMLDSVVVVDRTIARRMAEFEENRRVGLGKFLTRENLDRIADAKLSIGLDGLAGLQLIRGRNNQAWAARGRSVQSIGGRGLSDPDEFDRRQGAPRACYAKVYVDGVAVYRATDEEPLFDLNSLTAGDVEAVEYYAGPAQTPLKYSTDGSACGVVVIWRRWRR